MAERTPTRPRLSLDTTPAERAAIGDEASREHMSLHELVKHSLASRIGLRIIAEAELTVVLESSEGDQVLRMPASLFTAFLEADPKIVEHFTRKNPKS